ncbi:tape measure protein [Rhodococcus sp. IEGM 1366]|uniref:tape measure protein n=1 Tax=Rhodococcus sp. IEGM 1366 TaxID=3082223 RepID=UPI0039898B71
MGSKIASGIGSTLKGGAMAAGAVAATALTLGMQRVVAIDDAKGKLAGLGHTAEGVTTIMDSALASVKGTAFGMGDAATIAASAVAAGIKPGQELTKYLSLTGDAATIAGSSLEEMGSIFNKVQTSGKAYTDNLNQLSDRGIPIFQWLADEYGVTQDALSKMVKEGKVDAETFNKVIQENIGGAALESGKTLRGSFANMKAALGRAGAAVIEPFVPMMKAGLGKIGEFTDKITPHLTVGATKVASGLTDMGRAFQSSGESIDGPANKMERFGIKARQVVEGVKGVWSILTTGDHLGMSKTFGLEEDSTVVTTLLKIRETAIGVKGILFKGEYTSPIWGQLQDSKAVDVLFRIREGAQALWDVIKSPSGEKFTTFLDTVKGTGDEAAGAMGKVESGATTLTGALKSVGSAVAGDATALIGLGGDTATVAVSGLRVAGNAMGFLADHSTIAQVAVVGLAGALVSIKATTAIGNIGRFLTAIQTPATLLVQRQLTAALNQHTAALTANTAATNGAVPAATRSTAARVREAIATSTAASSLTAYAAAQRVAAAQSGVFVGGMRQAAAGVATFAGRVQGVAGATLSGMRSGLQRVGSMLGPGGLFTVGLIAGTVAIGAFISASNTMDRNLEENRNSAAKYAKSMVDFRSQLNDAFMESSGTIDSGVKSAVSGQIQAVEDDLDAAAKRMPSKMGYVTSFVNEFFGLDRDNQLSDAMGLADAAEDAEKAQSALDSLNFSQKDMANAVTGTEAQWRKFSTALKNTGPDGEIALAKFSDMRTEFIESQSTAGQFKAALDDINSGAVSAASGVDGLTAAMNRQLKDSMTLEDAQANATLTLDRFAQAMQNTGSEAFLASGQLDLSTKSGATLHGEMQNVASAFFQAGSAAKQHAVDTKMSSGDAADAVEAAGQRIVDDFIRQYVEAGKTEEQARAVLAQYGLFPKELPTKISLTGAEEAQAAINNFIAANDGRSIGVQILQHIVQPPSGPAMPTTLEGMYGVPGGYAGMRVPGYETGGKLPTTGPGTNIVDGFLGVDSNGIPTARVNRGEWVINDRSSEKYDRELASINAGTFPKLPGYVAGGVVGSRDLTDFVTGRIPGVKPLTGDPYVFGGINWGDCSAAMSAIARFAVGLAPFAARFATGNMGAALAGMGFQSGRGASGDLRFGWYNGGPYGGHAAGTLPDNTNVEMGGSYGGGMVGGTAGSNHPSMTNHAFMPIRASASVRGRKAAVWSEKQEADLKAAEIAVRKAEEARTEVENAVAEGKKTQTDLDGANNKVEKAQIKLTDMQSKKDGILDGTADAPAPQAPALSRMFTDAEVERIDAQLAVQSANERRNDVYNDPQSSDDEIDKADAELYKAEKALREIGLPKSGDGPTSWSGIAGDFAKEAASGFVSDALGVFGIPDEMPPALQAAKMFNEAQKAQAPYLIEPSANERAMGAQVTTSPSMIAADSPAIYNPAEGVARWGDSVARGQDGVAALLAEIDRFRGAARYAGGGPVSGESGVDKVPAWLTAREFVVNDVDANAGQNPAILRAMNNGARFSLDQGGRGGTVNNFHGILNAEDVIKRLRIKEMQDAASHRWGPG